MRRVYEKLVYYLFLYILVTLAIVQLIVEKASISVDFLPVVLAVLAVAIMLGVTDCLGRKSITLKLLLVMLLIAVYFFARRFDFYSYYEWLNKLFLEQYEENALFEAVTLLLVLLLTTPLYHLQRYLLVKAVFCLVFIIFMLYAAFNELSLQKATAVVMLAYSAIVLIEAVYGIRRKKADRERAFSYLVPVFLLLTLLLALFPTKTTPYEYKLLVKMWNQVVEWKNELVDYIDYLRIGDNSSSYLVYTGFSDEAKSSLAGEVRESSRPAMKLTFAELLKGSVYVAGKVYNEFDNNTWTMTDNFSSEYAECELEALEPIYALKRLDLLKATADYFADNLITLEYDGLSTDMLFVPKNAYYVRINSNKYAFDLNKINPVFSKRQMKGTQYSASFYFSNQGNPLFEELVRQSETYRYKENGEALFDRGDFLSGFIRKQTSISRIDLNKLYAERAERIREKYLYIPENTSQRMYRLADMLMADVDNTLDKLRRVEAYFQTFEYSTEVDNTAENSVENFLFNTKKGYCSYFATAAALLLRCEGIPTRYVQGFCVSKGEEGNDRIITDADAHAWTEAYIEGFGWVTVEATKGSSDDNYIYWEAAGEQETQPPSNYERLEKYSDYIEGLDTEELTIQQPEEEKENNKVQQVLLKVLAFATAAIIFIAVMGIAFRKKRQQLKYNRKSCADRAEADMSSILRYIQRLRIEAEDFHTLRELKQAISEAYPMQTELIGKVFDAYEKFRYGNFEIDEALMMSFVELRLFLKNAVCIKEGRLKSFVYFLFN